MLTPERIGFEPEEPFNRADCVRYTARAFILSPSPLVGQEIGTKLFVERSGSLDLDVAQRVTQFRDPGVELTDEKLREFGEQEKLARRAFGPTIVEHAGRFGLVETLTPEQAKACLALAPHVNLVGLIDQQYSGFSPSGWDVFPSKDDNKPVLLVPTKFEEGQASFDIVRLDDLYGRDPEFLRQQIIEYEEKYAMYALANSVIYNLKLHQVSKEELIPEYMREVAQIADPEQRAREVRSIQAFLNRMVKLGYGYQGAVYGLNQELSRIRPMGNGYSYNIQSYLRHMARCPTQTEEAHQRSANLIQVYNDLLSVDYNVAPFDWQTDDPVIRVLQEPARHTVYLDQAEEERVADREQDKKVDENIRKVRKYREDIAKFKSQIGITDEEIANLIKLTEKEDRDDDFGPDIDFYLYTGLFNALVLSKQGIVDMQSPAFKALLKSLFPDSPATLWKNP